MLAEKSSDVPAAPAQYASSLQACQPLVVGLSLWTGQPHEARDRPTPIQDLDLATAPHFTEVLR